jgi:hypothetical protein
MASSTKNVKIGVCKVFYAGYDLGYTKGGVEVSVTTETYKVNVDQFGKTTINEYVMGRDVTAKVPLAETTAENLVATMPGATLTTVGGAVATGTITITTNPTNGETILVNGYTITFKTTAAVEGDVTIGAAATNTATNLAAALNALTDAKVSQAVYSASGAVVTVKWGPSIIGGTDGVKGTDGNAFTLVTGTAAAKVTMSGATLSGGTEPTSKIVSATTGTGTDLLTVAKELRLHPVGKPDSDRSDDFVIPLSATPGALTFAYKLEDERVFNVDFMGYPDSATGVLFKLGA